MPNLQPYADPTYFFYLLVALAPLAIGLYFGKRFVWYEILVSLAFIFFIFDTGHYVNQGIAILVYSIWQFCLVSFYSAYRKTKNANWVFYLMVALSILPITMVRFGAIGVFKPEFTLLGFLGISYLTFRSTGMIIETRDGAIKEFKPIMFLRFMLFMPTLSSGPIDRYTRFAGDAGSVPERTDYIDMLSYAVKSYFLGFVYKFILSYYFGQIVYPFFQSLAMGDNHHGFSWWLIGVAYSYGMYLFFDFAGYSRFAIATSYVMGIKSPINFNQPYRAHNIKDFWNRWHMSLSFWFRDFVFMRFSFMVMRKKWIKSRTTVSNVGYLVNMMVMGLWHGLTWYYIVYALLHGTGMIVNDAWLRFKKKHRDQIPHNKFTELFAIFLTFNFVMLTFLVFCGFLDKFWFHH